jgi:hypothetical protein
MRKKNGYYLCPLPEHHLLSLDAMDIGHSMVCIIEKGEVEGNWQEFSFQHTISLTKEMLTINTYRDVDFMVKNLIVPVNQSISS